MKKEEIIDFLESCLVLIDQPKAEKHPQLLGDEVRQIFNQKIDLEKDLGLKKLQINIFKQLKINTVADLLNAEYDGSLSGIYRSKLWYIEGIGETTITSVYQYLVYQLYLLKTKAEIQ